MWVLGQSATGVGTGKVDSPASPVADPAQPSSPGLGHSSEKKVGERPVHVGNLPPGVYNSIEEALKSPDKVVVLDLKYKQLDAFPKEITQFKNLEQLDLAHNQITSIPAWVGELSGLRTLALNNNRIAAVPAEIGQLSNLGVLILSDNSIASIDPAIGKLSALFDLQISGNGQVSSFQPAIMQLKGLQTLRLWNFGFETAPGGIEGLTQLQTLCLAHNDLREFPVAALKLAHLSYLNLGDNVLDAVPSELGTLSELNYFGIYDNPVQDIPVAALKHLTQLQWLAAWGTQIPASKHSEISGAKQGLQVAFTNDDLH